VRVELAEENVMSRPRTLPDNEQVVRHLRDGWTYQQIADEYGTSREAVSALVSRHRLAPPKVGRHSEFIPWTIAPEHRRFAELRKLRYYSRRMQGEQLTHAEEKALDNWLREMDTGHPDFRVVVAYDRTVGWHYVEREPEDGDGIIRRPRVQEFRRTG
jgi:hypothetical protein